VPDRPRGEVQELRGISGTVICNGMYPRTVLRTSDGEAGMEICECIFGAIVVVRLVEIMLIGGSLLDKSD
jgi:uncharacterized membrane protein YeaQ/YmgE (transglycosylase-associated protein family)